MVALFVVGRYGSPVSIVILVTLLHPPVSDSSFPIKDPFYTASTSRQRVFLLRISQQSLTVSVDLISSNVVIEVQ